jgi:hypothetical protein
MQRRTMLRDLVLIAGGVTILPACLNKQGKASLVLKNLDISSEQEKLMAEIASAIIPQTDTPGAKELGSHLFVLKMLDDCYEEEDQRKFVTGLNKLEEATKKRFSYSFLQCKPGQREELLQAVEKRETFAPEVFDFYKIMKEKTLQGYLTSKYVVMDIMKYELIPSVPFNGYHLIKNTKTHGRQS